jgi:hypothetical protein
MKSWTVDSAKGFETLRGSFIDGIFDLKKYENTALPDNGRLRDYTSLFVVRVHRPLQAKSENVTQRFGRLAEWCKLVPFINAGKAVFEVEYNLQTSQFCRDSCKELRKEIFRTAKSAGLTRERIKQAMSEARGQTTTRK